VAPNVRPAATLPSARPRRQPAGWVLLLLLVGCLNPQPDPFPQSTNDSPPAPQRSGSPNDVAFAPSGPEPGNAAGTATAPATPSNSGAAAEQPAPPMTATPPIEAGALEDAGVPLDGGTSFDAGVPANGL